VSKENGEILFHKKQNPGGIVSGNKTRPIVMASMESVKVLLRRLKYSRYGFTGDYASWELAKRGCTGYDSDIILEKVKRGILKVKRGEIAFERDSVLFDSIEYSWPLLSALMWVAAINNSKLNVLDVGGSLGSSYFQNKYFIDTLAQVNWNILEQENFVQCGQLTMQDKNLQFFSTIDEATRANGLPDILLVACTLPYLKNPYRVLQDLMKTGIPYLMVDNTFFNYEERDRICVQKVPPEIYEASYPCWFLNYNSVKQKINENYSIISEHKNDSVIYLDGRKIQYKGFLAKFNLV
jgi:putative methyltransferase (TIGR04325 family)